MFANNLIVALRVLVRHRFTSIINVLGLSLALAVCTLVGLYVEHEWRFDGFHDQVDRIHIVWERLKMAQMARPQQMTRISAAVEEAARTGVAGVEQVLKVQQHLRSQVIGEGDPVSIEGLAVDAEFFQVFNFPLAKGDIVTALADPRAIVLSAEAAGIHFGPMDPMGKTLTLAFSKFTPMGMSEPVHVDLTVTGVLAPIPTNSSIRPQMLVPFALLDLVPVQSWPALYLVLSEGADPVFIESTLTTAGRSSRNMPDAEVSMHLLPMRQMHWTTELIMGLANRGKPARVYALLGVGALILLIACINFVNLCMARAATRTREIGVRKTVGANRGQLVGQFLAEAILMSAVATAAGVAIAGVLLPGFSALVDVQLSLDPWSAPTVIAWLALTVTVGLAAGLYPAVVASHFEPVKALGGRLRVGGRNRFGSGLICAQFAISSVLVVGTLTIERQIDYMQKKDLGFDAAQVAVISSSFVTDVELQRLQGQLRGDHVLSLAGVSPAPGWGRRPSAWTIDGARVELQSLGVSREFVGTVGLRLIQGRDFSAAASDQDGAILVNEKMAAILGAEALGYQVRGLSGF
ncbi:MAG: FtsX-like permease family protein, partial [Gemmatimonadetes bacterium]|nr:FtsX-like permease family protein [Gemmatimonadota bacterium]